jgi:hypothetical protein
MFSSEIVTKVYFSTPNGYCRVEVDTNINKKVHIFSYYTDELSFNETELVGKTVQDCVNLFSSKDIAYLQS